MAHKAEKFRVALVQMRSGRDIGGNLLQAEAYIREAAGRGAHYIQTPENTLLMEADGMRQLEKLAPEDQTVGIQQFSDLAGTFRIWLHIGSIAIKAGEGKAVNRAFLFAPNGDAVLRYDKIHMFDVNLSSGENYRESATFIPGGVAYVAELPWGGLGVSTCYDIRFPEQYKALAKAGAKFLTAPSAFTKVTGEKHWHILLRARAIENGCFVFAAAQGGRHASGRTTYGHSLIVSPWGEILGEGGTDPGLIMADIDTAEVDRVRGRIPALDHSRDFKVKVVPLPKARMRESAQ